MSAVHNLTEASVVRFLKKNPGQLQTRVISVWLPCYVLSHDVDAEKQRAALLWQTIVDFSAGHRVIQPLFPKDSYRQTAKRSQDAVVVSFDGLQTRQQLHTSVSKLKS